MMNFICYVAKYMSVCLFVHGHISKLEIFLKSNTFDYSIILAAQNIFYKSNNKFFQIIKRFKVFVFLSFIISEVVTMKASFQRKKIAGSLLFCTQILIKEFPAWAGFINEKLNVNNFYMETFKNRPPPPTPHPAPTRPHYTAHLGDSQNR